MKILPLKTLVAWCTIVLSSAFVADASGAVALGQFEPPIGIVDIRQLKRKRGRMDKKGMNKKGGKSGMSKKGGKSGKSGSKMNSKKSSKGDYFNCKKYDFLDNYKPVYGKGKGKGKGRGRGRGMGSSNSVSSQGSSNSGWSGIFDGRQLQFGGENCSPNTFAVAADNPELSIFVELIKCAGLEGLFSCAGPFTVLAPSNAAFNENPSLLEYFRNPMNQGDLEDTLLYHILPGFYLARDFEDGEDYKTLQGGTVEVDKRPLMFNQAGVVETDIHACNGVIDIIDDILIPPGKLMFIVRPSCTTFRRNLH
jgi:hypothetical protein